MKLLWPVALLFALGFIAWKAPELLASEDTVSVGRDIHPVGTHVGVGSYPIHMLLTWDGKYAVVSTIGFREHLSLVRTSDGTIADQVDYNGKKDGSTNGLYFGLAFDPKTKNLAVSEGARDRISFYDVSGGKFALVGSLHDPAPSSRGLPFHKSGIAYSDDGKLVTVDNQTGFKTDYKGGVSVFGPGTTPTLDFRVAVGGYPYDVVVVGDKAYVSCERDSCVDVVDLSAKIKVKSIRVGSKPGNLIVDWPNRLVYVSNSGSDTVSVIDPKTDKVVKTILIRPAELRALPGVMPLGMALSPDVATLYVACSGLDAIGVVDLATDKVKGYIPTGWLPTDVMYLPDGHLLVASAKGVKAKQPNAKDVNGWGTYVQDIYEGTVSRLEVPDAAPLAEMTRDVMRYNFVRPGLDKATLAGFSNPGIKHVVYVIKENRTYDNVLGDMTQGNGDPSICLFPRRVTPNQHALAERFVLLDNFHVCAEVSQDGWVWSTAGMISAYASRNTPYNYSGRGRSYDTEGSNSGIPVDLIGLPDVATPPSGYLWDLCAKHGVSFRNYGFYNQFQDPADKRNDIMKNSHDNTPTKKALLKTTDLDYRHFDLSYPDSEAYEKYGFTYPSQRKTYGTFKAPSRFTEWKREFDQYVKRGQVPQLMFVRLGDDHTSGTASGMPTPESQVADNDYAVGQLVDAISHSPVWDSTVICVLEDDAQAGLDHVDAHRSTAYVISPFIAKNRVDSRFFNTDSMLRTMELLLGMPPMSEFDATAPPISVFSDHLVNAEPYTAVLPDKDVVCKANVKGAYRQADSNEVSLESEESEMDEQLNDILWVAVKGTPYPGRR